jgi:PAS domain S-box-containing protein
MPSFANLTCLSHSKDNKMELPPLLKFMGLDYGDILNSFPEGVFLVNTRWQIGYFNQMAEEITGYNQDEVLGKFCWDIFQADLCHKNCPMRISMSSGEVILDREVEITTKAGFKKLILINTSQVLKASHKVIGGIETFHELVCPEAQAAKLESHIFWLNPVFS